MFLCSVVVRILGSMLFTAILAHVIPTSHNLCVMSFSIPRFGIFDLILPIAFIEVSDCFLDLASTAGLSF